MTGWRDYLNPEDQEALSWFESEHGRAKADVLKWSARIERIRNRCTLRQRRAAQSDGGKGE